MPQFSVHDAKTNLSKLIAQALEGEDVVIARGTVPVVRIVPIFPLGKRQFGKYRGLVAFDERFNEPLPQDELTGWNAE